MSEVVSGACLCGQVEFELHDAQTMGVCHCTRCRRWTGGAAALVAGAADNFKVTKGQDLLGEYAEEGFAKRYFCSNCGSPVYSGGGEVTYVAAGVLRDVKLMPAWHVQVASKEPWDEIGGDATQFAEYPPH